MADPVLAQLSRAVGTVRYRVVPVNRGRESTLAERRQRRRLTSRLVRGGRPSPSAFGLDADQPVNTSPA